MAFFTRLTGYSMDTGELLYEAEPPWWAKDELAQHLQFDRRESSGYLDYAATISARAAADLHNKLRPNATRGVFGCVDWQRVIQPMLLELDEIFGARIDQFSHFRVELREWESGLG
jgi:hypothetical protein